MTFSTRTGQRKFGDTKGGKAMIYTFTLLAFGMLGLVVTSPLWLK